VQIFSALRDRLECKDVIIGHKLMDSKFLQFVAAVNLRRNVDALRRFELGEITIVLTTRFKIDQKRMRLYVPWTFTEEQFDKFVIKTFEQLKNTEADSRSPRTAPSSSSPSQESGKATGASPSKKTKT